MLPTDIPRANFTISDNARRGIERVRQFYRDQGPSSDPPVVPLIGWGRMQPDSGAVAERVVVGFYPRSQAADVAKATQPISGIDVFFFAGVQDYPKFEGKVLDFDHERGFFLRAPARAP